MEPPVSLPADSRDGRRVRQRRDEAVCPPPFKATEAASGDQNNRPRAAVNEQSRPRLSMIRCTGDPESHPGVYRREKRRCVKKRV